MLSRSNFLATIMHALAATPATHEITGSGLRKKKDPLPDDIDTSNYKKPVNGYQAKQRKRKNKRSNRKCKK